MFIMDFKLLLREFLCEGGWLVPVVGAFGMLARIMIDPNKHSLLSLFRKIFSAAISSGIAWFILNGAPFSDFTKAICYGVIGVISPEIIQGLIALAKKFEKNPSKFIKK